MQSTDACPGAFDDRADHNVAAKHQHTLDILRRIGEEDLNARRHIGFLDRPDVLADDAVGDDGSPGRQPGSAATAGRSNNSAVNWTATPWPP